MPLMWHGGFEVDRFDGKWDLFLHSRGNIACMWVGCLLSQLLMLSQAFRTLRK